MIFDMIAARTFGLVQAKDVRVVWVDGTLYVAKSPTDIAAFPGVEQPKKQAGTFKAVVGQAAIRFQPPGCGSCRKRIMASPLGQMTVDQIVAAASVDA